MSNTKYTPGPWALMENEGKYVTKYFKGAFINSNANVGFVSYKDCGQTEGQANAKLISAAPDLLEALQKLKNWVGKLEDWKGEDPPFEIVDLAIKKATE